MTVTTSHTQHITCFVAVLYSGLLRLLMMEKLVVLPLLQLIVPVFIVGGRWKISK